MNGACNCTTHSPIPWTTEKRPTNARPGRITENWRHRKPPFNRSRFFKSGLSNVQRLTTDTWDKHLNGWGSDNRTIYFCSNRNGRYGVYKQDIHQQAAESVVSGPEDYSNAQLSADGASLLYTATANPGPSGMIRLMSVPVQGATPLVLASGDYGYRCALPPSTSCALSEVKQDQTRFHLLDPKRGPAAEPFKSASKVSDWSLSPDGQQIALVEDNDKSQVQILSLSKGTDRRLDLGKWTTLQSIAWSTDGRGLYVTAFLPSKRCCLWALMAMLEFCFNQGTIGCVAQSQRLMADSWRS